MTTTENVETIIIGGGAGGAGAALRLGQLGRKAMLLERSEGPRFHIGESVLPYLLKLFEKLEVLDRVVAQNAPSKRAIETAQPDGTFRRVMFTLLPKTQFQYAYNLTRATHDALMLDIARERGIDVRTGVEVKSFLFEGERIVGVVYTNAAGEEREVRATNVIDASGRAGLIANRVLRSRRQNSRL
ncbi:MAG: tryptophan 7-halogenase, partial [Polyangiaceae bacterium]